MASKKKVDNKKETKKVTKKEVKKVEKKVTKAKKEVKKATKDLKKKVVKATKNAKKEVKKATKKVAVEKKKRGRPAKEKPVVKELKKRGRPSKEKKEVVEKPKIKHKSITLNPKGSNANIRAIKVNKKSTLGLKKKYNDIEDLKNDLMNLNHQGVDIVQSDVVNALDRFEMKDEEIDAFYDWLSGAKIELLDESEDENLEDDDLLASEDDDDQSKDSERNIVVNYDQAATYTKVNDPVKMYLKEIGRVNL
ncbi:MAG: hypothetical protein Q4E99_06655, partial [Bacillota bacterium]|nr:hypothetical protein [Bacillota bacterium]